MTQAGEKMLSDHRIPTRYRLLRKMAPFMSLALMALMLSLLTPYFLTVDNLLAIGLQMSVVAIMAVGQMMVIISGGIDLSVGSVMALSSIFCALLLASGVGIPAAITAGIAGGMTCGLLSGLLIGLGHLPPFIATLGMMGIARGFSLLITGGIPVFGLPASFNTLGGGRLWNILPIPVIITLIIAVCGHMLLTRFQFGRHIYAIGSNKTAARLSGINVRKTLVLIYCFNGMLCGIAGIILASRLSTGQPTAGTGYELDVIAACVIGGASLNGGQGTILVAMIGALIMGVLRNGSNLLNISAFWQQIIIGTIIIAAVLTDQLRKRKENG
jgi:ribose transport system permease protein